MALNNPYQAYQNNSITTASPGELTLMLYNGCIKFIHLAKSAIVNKQIEDRNVNIQKAQDIIRELMTTLKTDVELGKSMMEIYDYIYRRLIDANVKNDVTILDEVEGLVTEFRDTWKQVVQLNRQQSGIVSGKA